jgi:RNA polymerase sigma-70 factor (ECF subfamily)
MMIMGAIGRATWRPPPNRGVVDAGVGGTATRLWDDGVMIEAARAGDQGAFEDLVAPHRRELLAHCYRMLGCLQDAEDALQETLLAAWRGIGNFEGRSSLRAWLFRIATNACLRLISRRPRRVLTPDFGPSRTDTRDLGEPVPEQIWLEPWLDEPPADLGAERAIDDPAVQYERRESVELAFIATLQHLPGTQRAVLLLRDVLGFSAAEAAGILDTTPASVNSAIQRARKALGERLPDRTQAEELDGLGDRGRKELVEAFVSAWEAGDVDRLTALLAADARFTMPPLPAWFDGLEAVATFFRERIFDAPWQLRITEANGQPAVLGYRRDTDGTARLAGLNVLTIRGGRIVEVNSFLDPALHERLGLPQTLR